MAGVFSSWLDKMIPSCWSVVWIRVEKSVKLKSRVDSTLESIPESTLVFVVVPLFISIKTNFFYLIAKIINLLDFRVKTSATPT